MQRASVKSKGTIGSFGHRAILYDPMEVPSHGTPESCVGEILRITGTCRTVTQVIGWGWIDMCWLRQGMKIPSMLDGRIPSKSSAEFRT
jgi:hypothetical protein